MKNEKILKEDFSKNLLKRIKDEKIKQTPKYIFILKRFFVWLFLLVSLFISALSIIITFEYLYNADWYLLSKIGFIKIITIFLPFFWLLLVIITSFLGYFNFRNTQKGYKVQFVTIFIINIFLSIFIGMLLYITGINNYLESKIENNIPKYRELLVEDKISRMLKVWQNEEKGLLIGKIIKVNINNLVFKDNNNKIWTISLNNTTKTDIKHRVNIIIGEKIKIIGDKNGDNTFQAKEIRPFLGKKIR